MGSMSATNIAKRHLSKVELLNRLQDLMDQVLSIDATIPEETGYFSLEDDLVRRVRSLLRQSAELMGDVMDRFDDEAEHVRDLDDATEADFFKEIGTEIASQMALQEVSGLAFVSRGQLLDVAQDLDRAVEQRDLWKAASHCDTGLRRMGRALVALDASVRDFEGLDPKFHKWHNLEDSLEVRRIYSGFRRAVLIDEPDLHGRFENAIRCIADLRDLPSYPFLRIDDRLELRGVDERLRMWLGSGEKADEEDGERLWQDFAGFVQLLAQVSQRQELREHDRLSVDSVFRTLFESESSVEPGAAAVLEEYHLELLEPLLGCDDELDVLILHPSRYKMADLRSMLERLRRGLGQPFEAGFPDWPV